MKLGKRVKGFKEPKQLLLLDGALKKLVEYDIASITDGKYVYSAGFKESLNTLLASRISKVSQLKYGNEAGRKLITQIISMAMFKPSRRDIDNLLTAYVCLKEHINRVNLVVDKAVVPDLAYAVWYLNDHEPTLKEVEEWSLTSQA